MRRSKRERAGLPSGLDSPPITDEGLAAQLLEGERETAPRNAVAASSSSGDARVIR